MQENFATMEQKVQEAAQGGDEKRIDAPLYNDARRIRQSRATMHFSHRLEVTSAVPGLSKLTTAYSLTMYRLCAILSLFFASLASAQVHFHNSYRFSSTNQPHIVAGVQYAMNGDLILTMIPEQEFAIVVARINSAGTFLWATKILGEQPIGGAGINVGPRINEDSAGNLMLPINRFDSTSTRYSPAFIQLSSNGSFVQAHYFDFDSISMFIRHIDITENGYSAAHVAWGAPMTAARLVVDQSGSSIINCSMNIIHPWHGGIHDLNFEIAAGTDRTMELYTDPEGHIRSRIRDSAGATISERQYFINGVPPDSLDKNYIFGLDVIDDNNTFAALLQMEATLPDGMILMILDSVGDVLEAHGFEHTAGMSFPRGQLYVMPNGDLLVFNWINASFERSLTRFDRSSQTAYPEALDTDQEFIQIIFAGTTNAHTAYFNGELRSKDFSDPITSCEYLNGMQLVNATAVGVPISTPQMTVSPTIVPFVPTVTSITLLSIPRCIPTDIATQSPQSSISVYPNPVNDELIVSGLDMDEGEISMRITNMLGQEMALESTFRSNSAYVNTSQLPSGVYIVSIEKDGILETRKITVAGHL